MQVTRLGRASRWFSPEDMSRDGGGGPGGGGSALTCVSSPCLAITAKTPKHRNRKLSSEHTDIFSTVTLATASPNMVAHFVTGRRAGEGRLGACGLACGLWVLGNGAWV